MSRRFALMFTILIALVGGISLAGWVLGSSSVLAPDNALTAFSPTIATMFLFLAFSLFTFAFPLEGRDAKFTARAILPLLVVLGIVLLVIYFIDPAFEPLQSIASFLGGHPIENTSPFEATLIALGSIAILMNLSTNPRRPAFQIVPGLIALYIFAAGSVGLLGYAFEAQELNFFIGSRVSLISSATLICLGMGVIFVMGPETWPLFTFFSSRVQDQLLRFLLPTISAIFLIFSLTISKLVPLSSNPAFIIAVLTLLIVFFTAVLVHRLSVLIERRVQQAERGRATAIDELRLTNQKLGLLDSLTRHDMLNQLSLSLSKAELLRMGCKDSVAAGDLDDLVEIDRRIIAMLKFSKDYRNVGVGSPEWFHLADIVSNAILEVGVKGITAHTACSAFSIYADPMIEKVFFNLFDNAQRHGEKITKIDITCSVEGDALLVVVTDDGVGVPVEMKNRVFVHEPGSAHGFGLFLSKQILSITGISIIENGVPGRGTRFEIRVPGKSFRTDPSNVPPNLSQMD